MRGQNSQSSSSATLRRSEDKDLGQYDFRWAKARDKFWGAGARGGKQRLTMQKGEKVLNVYYNNRLAGSAWATGPFHYQGQKNYYLQGVYVDERYRGNGLGEQLIKVFANHVYPKGLFAKTVTEAGLALWNKGAVDNVWIEKKID